MSSKPIYHIPYTYLIGWTSENKWYYGCRYAKGCHPNDLFDTYFTSSKLVKKCIEEYGQPDFIKITKTFDNETDTRLWEHKVLRRMNVIHRDDFLNQTDNIAISSDIWRGNTHSPETRKIISEKAKLRYLVKENNPFYGKKHSEESKQKISKSNKSRPSHMPMLGKKHSEESKRKISSGGKGRVVSDEAKQKMSEAKKGVPRSKVQCPHCNKIGATGIMQRWHFDNCKLLTPHTKRSC